MNFFTKLIMGTNRPESKPRSVYLKETIAFKQIWNNKSYNDFGLERMLRLVLILSSFIMPGTLIRQLCGRKQLLIRKVVIEGYSLFKICWYYFLFEADLTTSTAGQQIKLTNILEVILCFGFIYSYIDDTNPITSQMVFSSGHHLSDLQTVYFSFVTSATIGYGDIAPVAPILVKLVLVQIMLSLFFLVIVITTITNRLHDDTFYNKQKDTYR